MKTQGMLSGLVIVALATLIGLGAPSHGSAVTPIAHPVSFEFGMVGWTRDQIVRVNALNTLDDRTVTVHIGFAEGDPTRPLIIGAVYNLLPNQAVSLDLAASNPAIAFGPDGRTEVRPVITVDCIPCRSIVGFRAGVIGTLEVFDSATGKTSLVLHPSRPCQPPGPVG